jgi:transcriptional regulator with PAS, ATPase and Fis domain
VHNTAQLIGNSEVLAKLRDVVERAAASHAKILVTGESGVGKDVVARLLHQHSRRRGAPFSTVNCAGVPESLLESELFGYARGSFTGAYRDNPGLLGALDGGTLFLDEIGEMSARMQALLLRFLETGELQPIGTNAPRRSDVRIIAATNRDLAAMVAAGTFRLDLFYRLSVINIHVPPLRQHLEDIPALIAHWLATSRERSPAPTGIAPSALARLASHSWPGNVRELRNVIERATVHTTGTTIDDDALPETLHVAPPGAPAAAPREASARLAMIDAMFRGGQPFWDVVYTPFINRDLTRADLRLIIAEGLERTRGSYKGLLPLFNLPQDDYKRLLNFLRKHGCHVPFHPFRAAQATLPLGALGGAPPAADVDAWKKVPYSA